MLNIEKKQGIKKYKYSLLFILIALCVLGISTDYFNLAHYTTADFVSTLSLAVLPILLILFFLRDEIFLAWLKFAWWYLPITLLLVIFSPNHNGGFLPSPITKELASLWLGGLFVIISLVLIVYKHFSLPRGGREK